MAAQQQTKLPIALDGWTMVGQDTAQDTSDSLPVQTEVGYKEKHKGLKGPKGSRFNVLEGMKESVDHKEMINHMKQQLQAIQSPGARHKVGLGQPYRVALNNRVGQPKVSTAGAKQARKKIVGHDQLDKLGQLQKNLCLAISSRSKPDRGPQIKRWSESRCKCAWEI